MSDGIRKSGKVHALRKLNDDYNLGLKDIEYMSTSQLRRKIFEIRNTKGLTIHKSSKYQKLKSVQISKPDPVLVAKIIKKKKYPKRMSFEGVVM